MPYVVLYYIVLYCIVFYCIVNLHASWNPPYAGQIGDACSHDDDCSHAVSFSECLQDNCTCDYDHMVVPPNYTVCIDSEKLCLSV